MKELWSKFCEFMLRERRILVQRRSSEVIASSPVPVQYFESCDDDHRDDNWVWGPSSDVNPATGLPMCGAVDVGGNVYGCSSSWSTFDD